MKQAHDEVVEAEAFLRAAGPQRTMEVWRNPDEDSLSHAKDPRSPSLRIAFLYAILHGHNSDIIKS